MTRPAISILVANRNGAPYLRDALDSVLAQTFQDFECIITDDASTDKSLKIAREYCARDKRFKLTAFKEHRGLSSVRNAGIKQARGKYIMFLDSDDAYVQTAAELLYSIAEMHGMDVVRGGVTYVADNFKFMPFDIYNSAPSANFQIRDNDINNFRQEIQNCLSKGIKISWVWNKIFKADAIRDIPFPENIEMVEDVCWTLTVMPSINKIATSDVPVCFHRMSKTGVTRRGLTDMDFGYLAKQVDYFINKLSNLYAKSFATYYLGDIMKFVYQQIMLNALRTCNRLQSVRIARDLRPFYNHPARLTQYLSLKKRFVFWWFMRMGK